MRLRFCHILSNSWATSVAWPLIPDPCFMMEYAQAVMQGRVELFFAVQEVIREECYM